METQTPGTGEDQRGKDLAETAGAKQRAAAEHGDAATPSGADTQAGTNQAEPNANDPANASQPASSGTSGGSGTTVGGKSSGGGRFANAMRSAGGFAKRNKKGIAGGSILVVLIVAPILAITFLLPLKLVSLMANLVSKTSARATDTLERREERIVLMYLAQKAGVSVGSGVVVEKGMVATLYANWSKNGFEKKLAQSGLEVSRGSAPGRLKVIVNGASTEYASLDDFANKDLNSSDARRFIRQVVQENTHGARWLHRMHLRRWLRQAAGIKRWSLLDRKKGKEATTAVNNRIVSNVSGPTIDNLPKDAGCVLDGESCPSNDGENGRHSVDGTDPARPFTVETTSHACEKGDTECEKQLSDDANSNKSGEIKDELSKVQGGEELNDVIKKTIVKRITKVAAGIGILDVMSTIDQALSNNSFGKLIEARRATQYADLYATWQTLNDQIKNNGGTVSGDEVNVVMLKLQDIQKASAFNCLYEKDCVAGEKLPDESKVGSGGGLDDANSVSNWYNNSLGIVITPVMDVYRHTVGPVVKFVAGLLNPVIDAILKLTGLDSITKWVGEKLGELLSYVLGSVADGTETNGALANGLLAGADVTYNGLSRDTLGAPKITNEQAVAIDTTIGTSADPAAMNRSMIARLFSPENPNSIVNRLAVNMPSTTGEAVRQSSNYLAKLVTTPVASIAHLFSGLLLSPAQAADPKNSYVYLSGVQQYGYSTSELNRPYVGPTDDISGPDGQPDGKVDEFDCPVISNDSVPNLCLADAAAVETLMPSGGVIPAGTLSISSAPSTDTPTAPPETTVPTNPSVGGDPRALAKQLANNPNMLFSQPETKAQLLVYANGGKVVNACGEPMGVSPYLSQALLNLSTKYRLNVDDIGFKQDRSYCETGHFQHPKGNAIDLQGIEVIGGGKTSAGLDTYDANTIAIVNKFATDFLAQLPGTNHGGIGQKQCGVNPTFPPNATTLNGSHLFEDSCDHLHVDVRNRDNLDEAAGTP